MSIAFSAAFRLCDPGKVHQHLLVHLWKDLPRFWLTPQNRLTPQQFSGNHISWKLGYLRNILILHVLGLSFQGKCLNLPTSTEPNKPDKHTLKFFPNQDGNLWNPNSTKILSPTTGFGAAKPEPDKVKPYSLILPLCPRFFWYPNHPKSILDLWFHKFNKKFTIMPHWNDRALPLLLRTLPSEYVRIRFSEIRLLKEIYFHIKFTFGPIKMYERHGCSSISGRRFFLTK